MKIKLDAETDPTKVAQLNAEWDLHKIKDESTYHALMKTLHTLHVNLTLILKC